MDSATTTTTATPRPERDDTDSKLRDERDRTDSELAKRGSALDDNANDVLELARERADDLVTLTPQVAEERATADAALEAERAAQRKAILRLLVLEREETDERLETERATADRAVASRDDFLAMVSHDVRDLLAGLAMSADLLMRMPADGVAGARTHQEAMRIRRSTARMNRLIGDLLDVVSMELGKLEVVTERTAAAALLAETMEGFQIASAARSVTMTSEVPDGAVLATFDHERLLQVMANLVGNALKFTAPGGTIALRLARGEGGIEIEVRDTGCGIAGDQLDGIFERFSQAARPDRRGLGLGLYISRCIVEAHGGRIWAESQLGQGSTFHVTLPV